MAYQVRLTQFEGPLDLLLHLVEQAQVDIRDIFVSEITAQYLSHMRELDELDMDTASEFLTMASTLVYIKSRSLLPKPPKEEDGEEDPAETLFRQLREYKAIKQAGTQLNELLRASAGAYAKLPEEFPLPPQEIDWTETSVDSLFAAFAELLNRRGEEAERTILLHEVQQDLFTIRSQVGKIRSLLKERKSAFFEDFFAQGAPKLEMIVTFMALLEMIARGEIVLKQKMPYAPIRILAADLANEDGEDAEYMDEQQA